MAVENITSWQSLHNNLAYQYTHGTVPVYTLTTDIDLNDEYPEGVSTTDIKGFSNYGNVEHTIIIDGKDPTTGAIHKIKNLRTNISNPQPIFNWSLTTSYSDATIIFRNIDFVNLILAGGHFYESNGYVRQLNFENCRFVGYRTGNTYWVNQQRSITCTSCYFDLPWYGAGSSSYDYCALTPTDTNWNSSTLSRANYCWFHESYGGWTITNVEGDSHSGCAPGSSIVTTQCARFGMSGCYIDGSMKRPYSWSYSSGWKIGYAYCYAYYSSIAPYFDSATPNVIDVDWYVDQVSASDVGLRVYDLNLSGVQKESMTAPNFSSVSYYRSTASGKPNIILATPAQMKNVEWLRSQGFPILEDTPSE